MKCCGRRGAVTSSRKKIGPTITASLAANLARIEPADYKVSAPLRGGTRAWFGPGAVIRKVVDLVESNNGRKWRISLQTTPGTVMSHETEPLSPEYVAAMFVAHGEELQRFLLG